MKWRILLLTLFASAAYAADNTVILTPGSGVTMKSKDVGSGVQAMQPIMSDASGNALGTTSNPLYFGGALTIANGWTPLKLSALTSTAVAIKASAGQLGMLLCSNTNVVQEYVQVFNIASGSVSVGSSTPLLSFPIPAAATGGFPLASLVGIQFGTAISVAATTTATGSGAPTTALDCNAAYN